MNYYDEDQPVYWCFDRSFITLAGLKYMEYVDYERLKKNLLPFT